MNVRVQEETPWRHAGPAQREHRSRSHHYKKDPMRVFPPTRVLENDLNSVSSIDLSIQATPRLQESDQSFTLNSSNASDASQSMRSEDQSTQICGNNPHKLRLKLKLNPSNISSYPVKCLDLMDLHSNPEASPQTVSSNLTYKTSDRDRRPISTRRYPSDAIASTTGRVSNAPATICSNSIDSRRFEYTPSCSNRELTFHGHSQLEGKGEFYLIGGKGHSDNAGSNEFSSSQQHKEGGKEKRYPDINSFNSIYSTSINSKSPASNRSGISKRELSVNNFSEKNKQSQTKVEAFFWDPKVGQASNMERDKQQKDDLSSRSQSDSLNSKDILNFSESSGSQDLEKHSLAGAKTEETCFAQPLDQSHVIFEQSLATLALWNTHRTDRGNEEPKAQFDLDKFNELMQRVKISEHETQEQAFENPEKKLSDVVSDTNRNSIDMRKAMASPRSQQHKAFSPKIKDMPRSEETFVSLNISESLQNTNNGSKNCSKYDHLTSFQSYSASNNLSSLPEPNKTHQRSFSRRQITDLSDTFNDNSPKILCLHCEKPVLLALLDDHNSSCSKAQDSMFQLTDHSRQRLDTINRKLSMAEELMVNLIEKIYNSEKAVQSERSQIFLIKAAEAVVRSAHLKFNNKSMTLIQKDIEHLVEIVNQLQVIEEDVKFLKAQNIASSILNITFFEQLKKIIEIAKIKRDLISCLVVNHHSMVTDETQQQQKPRSTSVGSMTAIHKPQELPIPGSYNRPSKYSKEPSKQQIFSRKPRQVVPVTDITQGLETTMTIGTVATKGDSRPAVWNGKTKAPLPNQKNTQVMLTEGKNSSFCSNESVKEWSAGMRTRSKENYHNFRASFIQVAMAQKSLLEQNYQSQSILISDLVEEAFELGLRTEEWEDYIHEKYKSRNSFL